MLFAAVIATPLAWWAMHGWLEYFAYRSTLAGGLFFFTTLIVFLLAMLTMNIQSIKAAMSNPVKSLRTE